MSDFSSQFAASSEGILQPLKFIFDLAYQIVGPLVKAAEGASDLVGMFV
ncbi:hypothetical protein I6I73_09390 [Corynebacterium striatum]|nr:hypothetical protein [Corynebacterium striatum]QQU78976.1 hypothetical protein I6I73_09390 [Corynebacterium striatum]